MVPTKPRRGIGVPTIPGAPPRQESGGHGDLGAGCRRAGRRAAGPRVERRRGARRDRGARRRDRAPAPVRAPPRERPRRGGRGRRALARGEGGPLCGVPITVKDSHYMAGVPTTHGTTAVEPYVPDTTVVAVRRLQEAGAVIFAKTATPEFCYAGTTPGTQQPARPDEDARRLLGRRRGRGRGRRRPARARRRRRRLDPHPGRVLRRRRLQADVRRGAARAELRRAGRRSSPTVRWPATSPTRGCHAGPGRRGPATTATAATSTSRRPSSGSDLLEGWVEGCGVRRWRRSTTTSAPRSRTWWSGSARRTTHRNCRTAPRPGRRSPPPRRAGRTPRRSTRSSARTPTRSWRPATRSRPTSTSAPRSSASASTTPTRSCSSARACC